MTTQEIDNKLVVFNTTAVSWSYATGFYLGQQFSIKGFEYTAMHEGQAVSLGEVIKRQGREALEDIYYDTLCNCLMATFKHITIGIEPDGHAHS